MAGQQGLHGTERYGAAQEPLRGHPYGHGDVVPGPVPVGGLLHGLLQQPAPELGGARGVGLARALACGAALAVLGHPQELRRGEEDALGRPPPCLGGDGRDLAGGQRDHGLVEQGELSLVQRGAQAARQLGLAHHLGLHLGGVQLDPVLAAGLGPVHGEIRVAHQVRRVIPGSAKATPMLAATRTSLPLMRYGWDRVVRSRSAISRTWNSRALRSRLPSPVISAANSSPPSRAAVSPRGRSPAVGARPRRAARPRPGGRWCR